MAVFDSGFNSLFTSGLSARHHERIKIMKKIIEEFSRKFSSYESAKDSLYVKAVNSGRCKGRLSSSCCEMYADIALVLYLKSDSSSSGFYSAHVPPKILTAWSVERTQVWNQALLNSLILFPPRYYSLMKMFTVPGYEGEDFMDQQYAQILRRFGHFSSRRRQAYQSAASRELFHRLYQSARSDDPSGRTRRSGGHAGGHSDDDLRQ